MEIRTKIYSGLYAFTQSIWFVVSVLAVLVVSMMLQEDVEKVGGPIDIDLCYKPILQSTRDQCLVDYPHLFTEADRAAGPSGGSDPVPIDVGQVVAFFTRDSTSLVRQALPPLDDGLYGL